MTLLVSIEFIPQLIMHAPLWNTVVLHYIPLSALHPILSKFVWSISLNVCRFGNIIHVSRRPCTNIFVQK